MLYTFNFNLSSSAANWFQKFVMEMVSEILRARSKQVAAKTWEMLPPPAQVRAKRGLKERYEKLVESSQNLTPGQAAKALLSIGSATFYEDVLAGKIVYRTSFDITDNFQEDLKNLLSFAFGLLRDLKNDPSDERSFRDDLYAQAYKSMPERICPFCGLCRFDAPHSDMPRHALDHYLSISAYPLFGTYLPNLVPMCDRCNSSFKLAADLLTGDAGNARTCVDPHGAQTAKVSLIQSEPFGNGDLPRWIIEFLPSSDAFETWDQVFKIRFRYKESVLDPEFKPWLDEFSQWALDVGVSLQNSRFVSDALRRFAKLHSGLGNLGFIKKPMFEMLAVSAQRQDAIGVRVTNLVKALCEV